MQDFRLRLPIVFVILLGCTIPFANITKVFGIEDGLSRITIILIMLIFLISELQHNRFRVQLGIANSIIFIGILFSIIGVILDEIIFNIFIGMLVKFLLLVSVYTVVRRYRSIFSYFITYYYLIFGFSLILSLPLWFLFPMPEFVFYDGSESRFGGLHFELFNYCFSLCIALCSWLYNNKSKVLGLFIFVSLGLLSGSNMFLIFALIFFVPNKLLHIFKYQFFSCGIFMIVGLFPIFIGFFLSHLDFLMYLGLREQSQFDADGSSIFVRLFPFSLAAEYAISLGFYSLVPSGLGHFESTSLVLNTDHSYGGTGSPKAMVDLGFLLFILLLLSLGANVARKLKSWGPHKLIILRLNLACIVFVSFGAGFFSLIAWSIFFMTVAWTGDENE